MRDQQVNGYWGTDPYHGFVSLGIRSPSGVKYHSLNQVLQ